MEVGAYQAKTHLSRLLQEVEQGKRFTITKHGVPIAVLAPIGHDHHQGVDHAIAELRSFAQGITLGEVGLRELIDEGRR
ncbi:MAG TPA: type II toxin-antitoxin system prevent-host-death family antitoxin [Candidatus Saccharimonadales bacterium]|nr:type II toxin-antitoxin system prevent-host-death family antitoxin [Candidatus Saccharimonadales bacterium]